MGRLGFRYCTPPGLNCSHAPGSRQQPCASPWPSKAIESQRAFGGWPVLAQSGHSRQSIGNGGPLLNGPWCAAAYWGALNDVFFGRGTIRPREQHFRIPGPRPGLSLFLISTCGENGISTVSGPTKALVVMRAPAATKLACLMKPSSRAGPFRR